MKLFNRQLRESRKAFGRPYKYVYTTEGRHGDKRLHHHIILNHYPGETEVLRKLWPDGDINWEPVGKLGFVGLAKYLTKEPMQHGREYVGDRLWTPSRNLEKPRITVEKVPDNYRGEGKQVRQLLLCGLQASLAKQGKTKGVSL